MMIHEEPPIHHCAPMDELETRPSFRAQEGIDIRTKRTIHVVFVVIPHAYGASAVQVDFCPWCGEQLTNDTTLSRTRQAEEVDAYGEYRKRWIKQGTAGPPMGLEDFNIAMADWSELEFLLPHAKPEHTDGLFRRKQMLRDKLALGVKLENPTSAEAFAEKVHEWGEQTPDFMEGYEPLM